MSSPAADTHLNMALNGGGASRQKSSTGLWSHSLLGRRLHSQLLHAQPPVGRPA